MKKYFEKVIADKKAKIEELRNKIQGSEDVNEVRALGETLQAVQSELAEAQKQLEEIDSEEPAKEPVQGEPRSLNPIKAMEGVAPKAEKRDSDPADTVEYRKAFMSFVQNGTPIPTEMRVNNDTTKTTDTTAVIPTTIINEIVKELKSYGNIYKQVRKMNIQGAVKVPILDLKPTATWISADAGESESNDQKIRSNTSVIFNYYGLECKVAQTLLVNVTTLDVFQQQFVELSVEAMAKALDIAIIKGSGDGQPLGVTEDSRVPEENVITISSSDIQDWTEWKKQVFAKMKKSYRAGKFFMAQGTFDGYIDGMVDSNGQPISRVNYGIAGAEEYRFGGKEVETVENDVISAYDDAETDDVIAVFFKPNDYAINSNLEMQTVKWVDHDTNQIKNKVILICDGKLIDPYGVLIIKKGE